MTFTDSVVLITGGTGSFGRKFTKVLLERCRPKKILIYSRDELKQFEMQQEFREENIRFLLGDVRDFQRLMLAMHGVDYVIHGAALKQVPAAEYNPMECIKTNVYGAENVIRAAIESNVKNVIALSTDKAANPINLYGATKLCSDKLFIAANNLTGNRPTRFSVVRYGNVVGSRGSVVPYFKKLLENGSDHLPVTHPQMTRFWITLEQGVDFVLKCFDRMQGGEIFIPKIPSVRIVDLATSMGSNVPVRFIGVRPGEKLHEVMCPSDDAHLTYEFADYYVIAPSITFWGRTHDYTDNQLGEKGKIVGERFEYNSGSNLHFLSPEEISRVNYMAGI